MSTTPIQVGEWELLPALHTIHHPAHGTRELRPKLVQILSCLAERPGGVWQRAELLERVWAGRVVNEEALTRAISELRTVLGDDKAAPTYIQTIRGGGYRLIAEIAAPSAPDSEIVQPRLARGRLVAAAVAASCLAGAFWMLAGAQSGSSKTPAQPLPLTAFPGRETDPAVSPDGRRVAFAWGGADDANYDIYVKDLGSDKLQRLTRDPARDIHPAWSPDGRRVAFLRTTRRGAGVHVITADGGTSEQLADIGAWATGLDWSPDGAQLLFANSPGKSGLRLCALDLATRRVTSLTEPGGTESDHSPVFSPHGTRIAFVRSNRTRTRDSICIAASDGTLETSFPMGVRAVRGIDWVAAEDHLVLAARERGTCRLYSMNTTTGHLSEILVREEQVSYPSLSADARTLVYEDASPRQGILRVALDTAPATAQATLRTTHSEREAYFSPDGSKLAFISDRSGSVELWVAAADGNRPRCLTNTGDDAIGCPRWSPDSQRIAYQRTSVDTCSVWVTTEFGIATRIHEETADLQLSSWSHDGAALYFGSDRDGQWTIWRIPMAGGAPHRIVDDDAITACETSDGSWLYYSKANALGIWRRPRTGGESELVVADFHPRFRGNWTLTEDALLFAQPRGRGLAVQRFDHHSGRLDTLFEAGHLYAPSFSFSPRTHELLVATHDHGGADLNIVKGLHAEVSRAP